MKWILTHVLSLLVFIIALAFTDDFFLLVLIYLLAFSFSYKVIDSFSQEIKSTRYYQRFREMIIKHI